MVTKEYAMAYTEVLKILSYVPEVELDKIPKEKLDFYKENMDKDYIYILDKNKDFQEQDMMDITSAILANIFTDYWATDEQKEAIKRQEQIELKKIEDEKREKYNPDNIFKQPEKAVVDTISDVDPAKTEIVEYREPFIKRIIDKIKKFFSNK